MNVLITSAGRRNYLVRYFQEALRGGGQVYVADLDPTAPALWEGASRIVLPSATDPHFVERLIEECEKNQVGLVVPLNDLELRVMARAREELVRRGTKVVVAEPDAIEVCLDKLKTAQMLSQWGISGPRTFTELNEVAELLSSGDLAFPLIVKPRWGSGSIGVEIVFDEDELRAAYVLTGRKAGRTVIRGISSENAGPVVLVQELISGQEYGLDVVCDLDGRYVGTNVRRKLGMRAGETDRAEVVEDPALEALGESLAAAIGHRGNLDVDVMVGKNGPFVIELNPRFGGGYPFAHEAGANVPLALVLWAQGKVPESSLVRAKVGWRGAKFELVKSVQ